MLKKIVVNGVLVAICLGIGLWIGPLARAGYERIFPEPAFTEGDYTSLRREAGQAVVMFSTSTCPHCADARALLQREGVAYRDFLIDESPQARSRYEALDGTGVPLIFIGDRRIVGYREPVILDALAVVDAKRAKPIP